MPVDELDDLARRVLDALDLGILVVAPDLARAVFWNARARTALSELGATGAEVPEELAELVRRRGPLSHRWSPSVGIWTPARKRYFIRARRLAGAAPALTLITLAASVMREADLRGVLPRHCELTWQQTRIAGLVCRGFRNKDIAAELGISVGTVKNYLSDVYVALDVRNRTELVALLHRLVEEGR